MSALVPDLLAAANAAGNLVRRHQFAAGGHPMDADASDMPDIHRKLAVQYALEAYAARLERDHLYAQYRAEQSGGERDA